MNQIDDAIGEIAREKRAVVDSAVLADSTGYQHFGIAIAERQFHIGVGFVIPQQHVETGFALLDQVVFQRQRFVLICDRDVFQIDGFTHQRAGFCVGLRGIKEIRPHSRAKALCLANVDDSSIRIVKQVDSGASWKRAYFLV